MELTIAIASSVFFGVVWGWWGSSITDSKGRGRTLGAILGAASGLFGIFGIVGVGAIALIPPTVEEKLDREFALIEARRRRERELDRRLGDVVGPDANSSDPATTSVTRAA